MLQNDRGFFNQVFFKGLCETLHCSMVKAPVKSLKKVLLLMFCLFLPMKYLRAVFAEVWAVTTESQCKQAHLPAAVSSLLPSLLLQIGRMLLPSKSARTLFRMLLCICFLSYQRWLQFNRGKVLSHWCGL